MACSCVSETVVVALTAWRIRGLSAIRQTTPNPFELCATRKSNGDPGRELCSLSLSLSLSLTPLPLSVHTLY